MVGRRPCATTMSESDDSHSGLQEFLRQRAFLRRLARSLLADDEQAEDLVQETWLAASSGGIQAARAPRAWLGGVLRNLAFKWRRGKERRVERERRAARVERWDAGGEVELTLDVQRRVVDAVQALSEPQRSAIVLRYYHDLGPREIAERQGVPLDTVKTRLRRGLQGLRSSLGSADGDARASWTVALLPLAAGSGRAAPPVGLLEGLRTTLSVGAGGIMAAKLATVVGLAILVTAGWWLVDTGPRVALEEEALAPAPHAAELSAPSAEAAGGEIVHEDERSAIAVVEAGPSSATPAEAPSAGWWLTLELRGWTPGDAGSLAVEVGRDQHDEAGLVSTLEAVRRLRLDVTSMFEEPEDVPEKLVVRLDHPAYLPAEVWVVVPPELRGLDPREPRELHTAVDLVRAEGVVVGRVRREDGGEVSELIVGLFPLERDRPRYDPSEWVQCEESGNYRLRTATLGEHVVVAADRMAYRPAARRPRPATARTTVAPGSLVRVDPLVVDAGCSIGGQACLPGGSPVPAAKVAVQLGPAVSTRYYADPFRLIWDEGTFELPGQNVEADAEGRFLVSSLAPRRYRVSALANMAEREPGVPFMRETEVARSAVEVSAPAEDVRLIVSSPGVVFRVTGDGVPVQAEMWVVTENGFLGTSTDERGLSGVQRGGLEGLTVIFGHPEYLEREVVLTPDEVARGGVVDVELERGPAPGTLALLVDPTLSATLRAIPVDVYAYDLDRLPADRAAAIIGAIPFASGKGEGFAHLQPRGPQPRFARPSESEIVVSGLRPARYLFRVVPRPGHDHMLIPTTFELEIGEGESVRRPWRPTLGGLVRVNLKGRLASGSPRYVLLDPDGEPMEVEFAGEGPVEGSHRQGTNPEPGLNELRPLLAPGRYELEIRVRRALVRTIPIVVQAGATLDVEIDLGSL